MIVMMESWVAIVVGVELLLKADKGAVWLSSLAIHKTKSTWLSIQHTQKLPMASLPPEN